MELSKIQKLRRLEFHLKELEGKKPFVTSGKKQLQEAIMRRMAAIKYLKELRNRPEPSLQELGKMFNFNPWSYMTAINRHKQKV